MGVQARARDLAYMVVRYTSHFVKQTLPQRQSPLARGRGASKAVAKEAGAREECVVMLLVVLNTQRGGGGGMGGCEGGGGSGGKTEGSY